ncbi:MAG: L-seryl-tRNA(Sec) selenium transferase [Phycisphaerales bacterium]|nr:L-seryl-tRNA(Sec) selenium transferase [Phycisphaerales bacterium]
MPTVTQRELLQALPAISDLLITDPVRTWLDQHPHSLVAACLRDAVEDVRRQILDDSAGQHGPERITADLVLDLAREHLDQRTRPRLRRAINATGVILHTNLGRAAWPECVVDSITDALKGYVTLEIDLDTGRRGERHNTVEHLLTELTGAEAATVVNNNAAATLLALAALAADREVIVSRGELIEIGGSFRLPEVMAQSGARLVEVGTTNRTHPRDYENAITDDTAAIMRAHPSNYRIVGFTASVPLDEMAKIAHARDLVMIDDLGAGALVDLEQFGLPHEPTVGESIAAGADVVLFSADKLIGASQGGIIVGRKALVDRIRTHPLARAVRADKSSLMVLERTLHLFRDPDLLRRDHPLYRMLTTEPAVLRHRADALAGAIKGQAPTVDVAMMDGVGYLGSGSLPAHALPTVLVTFTSPDITSSELTRRLRLGDPCVVARIEDDRIVMDVRTLSDADVILIAQAVAAAVQ